MLNLLDLIVEQVQVHDALDLVLTADAFNEVLTDMVKLAAHRDLWRH